MSEIPPITNNVWYNMSNKIYYRNDKGETICISDIISAAKRALMHLQASRGLVGGLYKSQAEQILEAALKDVQ